MAILTAHVPTSSGIEPTSVTPAGGGDKVPAGSKIRVENGNAGVVVFTMTTHQEFDGDLAIADRVESIPAGDVRVFLADSKYINPDDGYVDILSDVTTLTRYEVTA